VNLGRALLAAGRDADALAMLGDGLALCDATGRREYSAIALHGIGEVYRGRGAFADARDAFERSRAIFVELEWHDVWRSDLALARVALEAGDRASAKQHLATAVASVERARAALPPTADYARFAREVEEVYRLREQVNV